MNSKVEEQTSKRYRHMSFLREKFLAYKKFKEFERANSLRTFIAVPVLVRDGHESFNIPKTILVDLLPHLPLLRVLCLSKLEIDEVPGSVGDLKHLRYLNLSRTRITHLPENVCNLYNLQTLIVSGCYNLSKLPNTFSKLKNLRHLDIRDTPLLKNMPLGIGEMKSLQTLSKIVIEGDNEFPLSRIKNLKNHCRRISIHGLNKLQNGHQAREANLSPMRLSELVLEWSDVFDGSRKEVLEKEVLNVLKPHQDNLKDLEILSYGGTKFPKWIGDSSFCQLTVVRMNKCRKCTFLPPLGQLQSLKKLFIENMDEVKEVGSELLGTAPAPFPSLEILHFKDMLGWKVWSINSGVVDAVFPCLKELTIRNCPNLVEVSLEALPSLRVLRVISCGDGLLTSLVCVVSAVTDLSIVDISGLSDEVLGGFVQSLGAVEELSIWKCNEIKSAAEACKVLVNLKKLDVRWCENLLRLGVEEKAGEESNLLLTSLRMLQIWGCNNLKHLGCPNSVLELKIYGCKNLEHLSCPDSIEELRIKMCSSITSVSFPTGGGWQKLKSLEIVECNQVLEEELEKVLTINNTNIPPKLQVVNINGWKNLNSITKFTCFIQLTRLGIQHCPKIESFPELQNLVSLKHLKIKYCKGMDGPPRGGGVWPPKLHSLEIGALKRPISEWGPLPTSLVDLRLYGGSSAEEEEEDDVTSFPTSLVPSSSFSLIRLELFGFKKLETISKGLRNLTSLQHLYINCCPNMKELPETLLPSLLSLAIYDCQNEELKEKTSRGGSYWSLLSHIPKVSP